MTETTNVSVASEDEATTSRPRRRTGGLSGMVLPELQQLAQGLGITGTARMRKSQLIDAIKAAQGGAEQTPSAPASTDSAATTPARPATKRTRKTPRTGGADDQIQFPELTEAAPAAESNDASHGAGDSNGVTTPDTNGAATDASRRGQRGGRTRKRSVDSSEPASEATVKVSERSEDRGDADPSGRADDRSGGRDGEERGSSRDRDSANRDNSRDSGSREGNRDNPRDNRDQRDNRDDDDSSGRRRRRRGRDRFRDRRSGGSGSSSSSGGGSRERYGDAEPPQITDDDVLIPVAGILDVLDNYAFVRTSGFLPGPNDVYVSLAMVKRHGLRKGDAITGAIRQPREGERREKFNPLVRVDTVNGADPDLSKHRPDFGRLTPLYPQERLRLETEATNLTGRVIDLVSPIGKGQRGMIVSPSKAGKTLIMQSIANSITTNNPEVHLMVVLVDERPEEVTDFQRAVKGEVIASTFDRPADDHTTVAELAIERAKRLVELGHDVVVLLDGITRLGRAYNLAAPASGRILSGGVDSSALYPPKKFFGAARNIEDGGSLTILATALVETGSKMDEVIFEEFKGTGNMEVRLKREYADKRIFPAIDVDASSTRREELLMSREELAIVWKLRRVLSGLDGTQALELVLDKLKQTKSNTEFLMQINKTMPMTGGSRNDD